MRTIKEKISVTIKAPLARLLNERAKGLKTSKSQLVERALADWMTKIEEEDAKATAAAHFDDLPTADEWIELQSKWKW